MSVDDENHVTDFDLLPGVDEKLSRLISNRGDRCESGFILPVVYGDAVVDHGCISRLIRMER